MGQPRPRNDVFLEMLTSTDASYAAKDNKLDYGHGESSQQVAKHEGQHGRCYGRFSSKYITEASV